MADKDYKFMVLPDNLQPYGPVGKENMDVVRLMFDFTCYLDVGEIIDAIEFPTIDIIPAGTSNNTWRTDYPIDSTVVVEDPVDHYPLGIISATITSAGGIAGKEVDVKVGGGTPQFSYAVSFIVVGSTTRRRKQIDTIIAVEAVVNSKMLGPFQLDPDLVPPIILTDSTALPMGFDGLVIFNNSSNKPGVVITLPPNPVLGQTVEFIDGLGKNFNYPVTFRGDADVPVDSTGAITFSSIVAYDVLEFKWLGANWHIIPERHSFLAF